MRRLAAARFIHPRAGGDGIVGNLSNGRTVSGSLSNSDARMRYGYRSDDYNLQNIMAGTRAGEHDVQL